MEDEGIVMPLYWDCQELKAQLESIIDSAQRRQLIHQSIQKCSEKYSGARVRDKLEFSTAWSWHNLEGRLALDHLKGFIGILDFFTYCCINCMHILPLLEELERMFPTSLAVIGVHSAKFENEKLDDQIQHAIQRYNIHHPVCNDAGMELWSRLGVTCWPTLLILSPVTATPIHVLMGEGHASFLLEYLYAAMDYFKDSLSGQNFAASWPGALLPAAAATSLLRYPGKLAVSRNADGEERLVIADSGHNRLLVVDTGSSLVEIVVGSGRSGRADGLLDTAEFRNPQGVCWVDSNRILVADTDNHLLRLVDLAKDSVTTVGGTGEQGEDKEGGRQGSHQPISSPWDIAAVGPAGAYAIAMAGTHQIWLYCLEEVSWWKGVVYPAGTLLRIAGSGSEENRNNSYPAKAGFAQPSGLSYAASPEGSGLSGCLFIADSESSSIRRLELKDGAVKNVCGGERDPTNLFAYGDADGAGLAARLQHPLGVAWHVERAELYVADSYNHKIKKVSGPKNDTVTIFGGGKEANSGDNFSDRTSQLCEPGGLAVSNDGNRLYIADTNNHCIRILDLNTNQLSTLNIQIKEQKIRHSNTMTKSSTEENDDLIKKHQLVLSADCSTICGRVDLDPEWKLNPEAPSSWTLSSSGGDHTRPSAHGSLGVDADGLWCWKDTDRIIAAAAGANGVRLWLRLRLYLCSRSEGVCVVRRVRHEIELVPGGQDGADEIHLGNLF